MVSIHPIQAVKNVGSNVKEKVSNMSTKQKAAAIVGTVAVAGALTAAYLSGKNTLGTDKFTFNGKGEEVKNTALRKIGQGFGNFFSIASEKAVSVKNAIVDRFSKKGGSIEPGEDFGRFMNKPEGFEEGVEAVAEGVEALAEAGEKAGEALADAADKAL